MTKEDIVKFIFTMSGIVLVVVLIYSEPAFELTLEKLWKNVALSLGLIILICCVIMGAYCGLMIRYAERKKKGLRPEWHYEDMDELEERIRKLEEGQER